MPTRPFKEVRRPKKGVCPAYRCNRPVAAKKKYCHRHHAKMFKHLHFAEYTYNALKQNAKRRGKEFTLTLEEFKTFCERTGYLDLKGKKGTSASIDRIDPSKGYELGNIQVLSLSDNARKAHTDDACPF
jgi:hypothetical protein